jgi:hypothetical protein
MNHLTWMTKFGGEMSVIGRTLSLNGQPRTPAGCQPGGRCGSSPWRHCARNEACGLE